MRILAITYCFFCILNYAFGQDTSYKRPRATITNYLNDPLSDPKYYPKLIVVVDGKKIADSLQHRILYDLNPAEILEISTLQDSITDKTVSRGLTNTTIIVTKRYARVEYQKKLGRFSKEYNEFINKKNGDDSDILYVLNGIPFDKKYASNKVIINLYDLPVSKIKTLYLLNQITEGMDNKKLFVIITTKQ